MSVSTWPSLVSSLSPLSPTLSRSHLGVQYVHLPACDAQSPRLERLTVSVFISLWTGLFLLLTRRPIQEVRALAACMLSFTPPGTPYTPGASPPACHARLLLHYTSTTSIISLALNRNELCICRICCRNIWYRRRARIQWI